MSTTTIHFTLRVGAILTNATSVVFRDPTGAYGVRRTDNLAIVVAAGQALTNVSVGNYEYTFTDPAQSLTYNYWVEFIYNNDTFRIEQDISGGTGGGVSTTIPVALPSACISLPRYAEILELDENQFWGLNDGTPAEGCNPIWTENQRKRIARYLAEAQEEIERVTGYPLCPRWFTDEQQYYSFPVHTRWGKLLDVGFRNTAVVAGGTAVNYVADPASITVATTVTDESEIKVYYTGSDREIIPSDVSISGGNVTIQIPWCRLVKPENFNNPGDGWDYNDATIYVSNVDVKQVYNDRSIEAGLIFPHRATVTCDCDCPTCCGTCNEYSVTACEYILNREVGTLDVLPATYSGSVWTADCLTCYCENPTLVRLNYKAGLNPMTLQAEDAVVRLAHSKMPNPPCGCGFANDAWTRDRVIPEILTSERLNCDFGLSDGAWIAWRFANAMRLQRGMAFA